MRLSHCLQIYPGSILKSEAKRRTAFTSSLFPKLHFVSMSKHCLNFPFYKISNLGFLCDLNFTVCFFWPHKMDDKFNTRMRNVSFGLDLQIVEKKTRFKTLLFHAGELQLSQYFPQNSTVRFSRKFTPWHLSKTHGNKNNLFSNHPPTFW